MPSFCRNLGGGKIKIVHGNVLDVDATEATAVFVYLIPAGMAAVKEALVSLLRTGARVVTYGEWGSFAGSRKIGYASGRRG